VLPAVRRLITPDAWVVALIKPQFEAGAAQVGKGGVVRDPAVRQKAIADTVAGLEELGLRCEGTIDSPIAGAEGNREALALFGREAA
jgi:23S rRNA (cytidine1920-2'-O)/16S rRNA (cytidine1409-2'-O)-methyltransferase